MANFDPVDIAGSQPRYSKSARGRIGTIDTGSTSVASRDFAHDVNHGDPGAPGLEALAKGVANFIPVAQKYEEDLNKRDDERLKQFAAYVQSVRPKDVKEAIRTGDYSKLPKLMDGQETRGAFVDTLRGLTGLADAEEWAQNPDVVQAITESDDPAATRAELLKKETQGMDVVQAEHMTARAQELTDQNVTNTRLKNVYKTQDIASAQARTMALVDLAAGNIKTEDDYMRWSQRYSSIGAVTGAKSEMEARQSFDNLLMEQAVVYGNKQAMDLIYQPMESRNGQSIAGVNADKMQELEKTALSRVGDVQYAAQGEAIFKLQTGLSDGSIDAASGLREIANIESTWGPSSTTNTMRDDLNKQLAKEFLPRQLLGGWLSGQEINVSDMRKGLYDIVSNWGSYMDDAGITDPVAQAAKLSNLLTQFEPDGDTQNYLGRKLASDDPAEAEWTFKVIKGMDVYKRKTALSAASYDMYAAMETSAHFGKPIMDARERFMSAEKSDIPENRQLNDRFELDTKHKLAAINETVASSIDYAKAHGFDTGDVPFVPFDTPDMASSMAHEYEAAVNHFLYMGYAKTLPEAQHMAATALAPRLSVDLVNGRKTIVLRPEEQYTVDEKAQVKTYRPTGSADIDQAVTDLSAPNVGFTKPAQPETHVSGVAGKGAAIAPGATPNTNDPNLKIVGLRDDRLTALGGGKAVDVDGPDGPTELVSEAGAPVDVSEARSKTDLFKGFEVIGPGDLPGTVKMRTPTENTKVGDTGAWINDDGVMRFRSIGREYNPDDQAAKLNAMSGQAPKPMGGKRPPLRGATASKAQPVPDASTSDWLKGVMKKLTPDHVDQTSRNDLEIKQPKTVEEAQTMVGEETKASNTRAEFLLDYGGSNGLKFSEASLDFIQEHEGYVPYVYDDKNGKKLEPGQKAKGYATIGIGYNLTNATAREDLKAVGADYDSIMAGKSTLSLSQSRALASVHMKRVTRWLHQHFEGYRDKIALNQWVAMTSLAYNSRWKDGAPTLIGPKLTAAVKAGDMKAAVYEIAENSMGGVSEEQKEGIRIRRKKEAMMFEGNWGAAS